MLIAQIHCCQTL